jgi:hypothetical protein
MKTKTKEIVIKFIDYKEAYLDKDKKHYCYEIETNEPLESKAIASVITQTTNLPASFTEFMEVNNLSQEQTLEILNNYKKQ